MPPIPENFVGREIDVYNMLQLLLDYRVVNLIGEEGVGCSSLASAVSNYISERKTTILSIESLYFLRMKEQSMESSSAIKQLHDQLVKEGNVQCQPDGGESSKSIEILVSALKGMKTLVVFDSVNAKDEAVLGFATKLLESSEKSRLLLVSERTLDFVSASTETKVYKLKR